MKRMLLLTVISCALCSRDGVSIASPVATQEEPVAIVCLFSGQGSARFDAKRTEIGLFQRLRPGTFVETEADSRLVLAFFTGDRYEFGESASATLGRTGLENTKGQIQKLTPVPATVDIAPIAREDKPGTRLAAARIRANSTAGKSMSGLYPSNGAATIAETVVLNFDAVEAYQKYKLDLEDVTGNTIFSIETAATKVQIPPGVLRPGAQYYWRVRTLDSEKAAMRGDAIFSTLTDENVRQRAALKAQAEETRDRSLLGLLAEFDRSLGLQREACEELRAILDQSGTGGANTEALTRFGCSEADRPPTQRK